MSMLQVLVFFICVLSFAYAEVECFVYQRDFAVTDSTRSDGDLQLIVDLASLISASKLRSDCLDLRFRHGSTGEWFSHWHEGECDDAEARIWLQNVTFPSVTVTIEMFYQCRNPFTWSELAVPSSQGSILSSPGLNFYVPYAASSCPTHSTDLQVIESRASDRFLRLENGLTSMSVVDGSYPGHTNHIDGDGCSSASGARSTNRGDVAFDWHGAATDGHDHDLSGLDVTDPSGNEIPLHYDMLMCTQSRLLLSENAVLPLWSDSYIFANLGSNFREFSEMVGSMMRISNSYTGSQGGFPTHTHDVSGMTTFSSEYFEYFNDIQEAVLDGAHRHDFPSTTTTPGSNFPDHWEVVFSLALANISGSEFGSSLIFFTDDLPPVGFVDVGDLDQMYLVGSSSKSTGSIAKNHSHSISSVDLDMTATTDAMSPELMSGSAYFSLQAHNHDSTSWEVENDVDTNSLDHVVLRAVQYVSGFRRDSIDDSAPEVIVGPRITCGAYFVSDDEVCNFGNGSCDGMDNCTCYNYDQWEGNNCDLPVCDPPCGSNGVCHQVNSSVNECQCDGNWETRNSPCDDYKCEDDVWSTETPCSGHGSCTSEDNACSCDNGFEDSAAGFYCDHVVSESEDGDNTTAMAIGIAVGVTVPVILVVLALVGIALFCFLRKKPNQQGDGKVDIMMVEEEGDGKKVDLMVEDDVSSKEPEEKPAEQEKSDEKDKDKTDSSSSSSSDSESNL